MAKKKWIEKAIKHPGAEKRAAKKAGESTHEYMEKHKDAPGNAGKRARLGLELEGMHGKPISEHESTHHTIHTDEKGKEHHRVHHTKETTYEYPKRPATAMNKLLDSRGY